MNRYHVPLFPNGGYQYDSFGNVTNDSGHVYAYDGDGRICAVASNPLNGGSPVTQYIYDAEGNQVAKGSAHPVLAGGVYTLSCDTTQNGFSQTNAYLNRGGQQLTELTSSDNGAHWAWAHTNVWTGAGLSATYSPNGSQIMLNFHFTDWLGTDGS